MFINATLLVQIGSFLIAYAMLRILLFKPTVKIILEQEIQQHEVDERIAATAQAIQQLTATYQERQAHDQQKLNAQCPVLYEQEPEGAHIRALQAPPMLTVSERTTLQGTVANAIIKKVIHVS